MAEFARHGLDAPSLDAISARAGYTRGAFYVHFRDREDLIVAVMERVLGDFLDAVIATGDQRHDLEETMARFVRTLGGLRSGRARRAPGGELPVYRLLDACARSKRVRGRLASLLREAIERVAKAAEEGQAARSVRADVDADQLATLLVAAALGSLTAVEIGLPFQPERARAALETLVRT